MTLFINWSRNHNYDLVFLNEDIDERNLQQILFFWASTHSIYSGFFMMLNKDPTITTTNQSHTQKLQTMKLMKKIYNIKKKLELLHITKEEVD
jgi:ADP-dependent phosphofructokinase/glucokinase